MSAHLATKTGRVAAGGSLLVGGIAGALVLAPQAGAATTYTVTNTADSGAGSLRQAIADANNNAGADIVVFDASATGTITLTTGHLEISDDVTITGLGAAASTISGNSASRIFYIYNNAASLTVSISGLTMTDGNALVPPNVFPVASGGGAIFNRGNDLTLTSVVLTGNSTNGEGGAVLSRKPSSGLGATASLEIIDSEIIQNTASNNDGGGIALIDTGDLTITNSIISGNQTVSRGGGVYGKRVGNIAFSDSTIEGNSSSSSGGGVYIYNAGDVTIDSTTFDQNTATQGDGGGLYATSTDSFTVTNSTVSGNQGLDGAGFFLGFNGDVLIANSTFANNVGGSSGRGSAVFSWGSNSDTRIMFSTLSGNSTYYGTVSLKDIGQNAAEITGTVISDNTTVGGTGAQAVDLDFAGAGTATVTDSLVMGAVGGNAPIDGGGNITSVSAQLGALADNGGATFTMEPATGSPVIDAGPLTWTAFAGDGSDQRGGLFLRVSNGQSDMGALEVQPEPVPPTTSTSSTSTSSTTTTLAPNDTTTTVGTDPMVPAFTG
jgi:predicted outer membrane repeat protein/parallel beta-helix repeat protein